MPVTYTVTRRDARAFNTAAGTVTFTVATGTRAARSFQFTLASPTASRRIPWALGPITLASLVTTLGGDGTPDVTVSVQRAGNPAAVAVAGWDNITASIEVGTTYLPDDPVSLVNGDVIEVTWAGDGQDLSLAFSE